MQEEYSKISNEARIKVLKLIFNAQTSHIGSNFSCIDILTVLFSKINLDRDKFILSKGWVAASLYYFLWKKGRITEDELNSYCQEGSKFIGLAEPIHKDIIFAGGSMGLGLSAGVALAWSKKTRKQDGRIYVLESDGGIQVGVNWEAAWFADQHKLNNLTLIIDKNGFQAMKKTSEVLNMDSLRLKFMSFGWEVVHIDGHNFEEIETALVHEHFEKPIVVIADTIKGKGVKRFEGNNLYHYKQLSKEEYEEALNELK